MPCRPCVIHHDAPFVVKCDNGPAFVSDGITELLRHHGVLHPI